MILPEIVHGTQYYRSPTPLPEEWEGDIAAMGDYELDLFQIRVNWRWNERREDEYDFSDVDRLMDLAEGYGKKVVIKFLLECAPQYIYEKYGGTRIGPRGETLRGGSHGAFYGGWMPCFTNPDVRARAKKFVEKTAERYCGRKNLLFWNAWNEIRNRPMEECFCPHCRRAFGKYLKRKFGTVEELNAFYGTAEESFDRIALPSTPHGYWDIFEFKKFKGSECLSEQLAFVREGVEKYDKIHPVMSHVGFSGAFQYHIGDVCDDFSVSRAVAFFGTSVACDSAMDTHERRLDYLMLNDYMRAVDENYFVYEIYPGLGMFRDYDTPFDMSFKTYGALASGAKGILYWQYRAERVGHEGDCAGLMRADGSPREVAFAVKEFGTTLKRDMKYFVGARAERAQIGIVFDFDSMLMSEIEDACGKDFSFAPKEDALLYYRKAHAGMYRLLRSANYDVDYVGANRPERFSDYKALYFPYYTMLDPAILPALCSFVEEGGILLADEGFGMRQRNTWMRPYDIPCKPLFTARLFERRLAQEEIALRGTRIKVGPYKTQYRMEGGETLLRFDDGSAALQVFSYGKGKICLFGFSFGYSYYENNASALSALAEELLQGLEKYPYACADLYEKRLYGDGYGIVFLFNVSDRERTVQIKEEILGGNASVREGTLVLPPKSQVYLIVKGERT